MHAQLQPAPGAVLTKLFLLKKSVLAIQLLMFLNLPSLPLFTLFEYFIPTNHLTSLKNDVIEKLRRNFLCQKLNKQFKQDREKERLIFDNKKINY